MTFFNMLLKFYALKVYVILLFKLYTFVNLMQTAEKFRNKKNVYEWKQIIKNICVILHIFLVEYYFEIYATTRIYSFSVLLTLFLRLLVFKRNVFSSLRKTLTRLCLHYWPKSNNFGEQSTKVVLLSLLVPTLFF